MDKLKPCPFCGGEAMFLRKSYMMSGSARGWAFGVCCKKCGVTLKKTDYRLEVDFECSGEITVTVDERPQATDDWNRRVNNAID